MADTAFCYANPDVDLVDTHIIDARPGLARLAIFPFYPGGGGQLPDRGLLRSEQGEFAIASIDLIEGEPWIRLVDETAVLTGPVQAQVDRAFRQSMRELHTGTHILNALVFSAFEGALVTGAQLGADGTARLDFDLPGVDNDILRALEGPMNDVIRQDLPIETLLVPIDEALQQIGLIRSKSVAPPPSTDGLIRIVNIKGLDRQACGGTHLASTGQSRPIRIQKIENKGKHNRRIRIAIA